MVYQGAESIKYIVVSLKNSKFEILGNEVEFRADSLQTSADFGHWHPSTDSYLGIYGIQKDADEKLCVRKFITESM